MKTYIAPEVVDYGGIAQITGQTGHDWETDTSVDKNGNVSHPNGPASEFYCQYNPPINHCEFDNP